MDQLIKIMKSTLSISTALRIVLVLIFIATFQQNSYGQEEFKVMTYNIYHGEDPTQLGTSNLQEIAELIRQVQPDFVALQEVDSLTGRSASLNDGTPQNLVQELAEMTDMHGYFGKAIDYDGGGYGEGILSREPVNIQKVMLPIPNGGEDRALLIAETETQSGNRFIFAGTHLCHQFSENRLAQARKINKVFESIETPSILVGDLNFVPDSEAYQALQNHWIDMAVKSGNAEHTFSFENPTRRIDYMFISKQSLQHIEIVDFQVLKVAHSDHMPVVATIRLL
jgi:endonuclease/exonuclease/phosphatase family metal-dependent hydrolase